MSDLAVSPASPESRRVFSVAANMKGTLRELEGPHPLPSPPLSYYPAWALGCRCIVSPHSPNDHVRSTIMYVLCCAALCFVVLLLPGIPLRQARVERTGFCQQIFPSPMKPFTDRGVLGTCHLGRDHFLGCGPFLETLCARGRIQNHKFI